MHQAVSPVHGNDYFNHILSRGNCDLPVCGKTTINNTILGSYLDFYLFGAYFKNSVRRQSAKVKSGHSFRDLSKYDTSPHDEMLQ
jgi:hypothetical protein